MARPHILFIQAQDLPWSRGLYGSGREDVESKILSIDEAGTDATCIVRYPPGWRRETEHLTAHEEFLVLDGAITINDRRYEKHTYGFLPSGYPRERAFSDHGAVLLNMFYDKPEAISGMPASWFDEKLLIEYVNPLEMEWDAGLVDPQLAKGVAIKPLREDPYTKEVSFLYCSPPHRVPPGMAKPQWTHPMVEELYCLAGQYVWGDCGRMGPGGYAWWREGVYHGPAGTDTGYNLFVRTVNGPLVNEFATDKKPFTWEPEFRPLLPDELQRHAKPYKPPPNY
jgi:hypothetical protein